MNAQEITKILADFANTCSNQDVVELVNELTHCTHRTLQQKIMSIFLGPVVTAYASAAILSNFDYRNQATVDLCERIAKTFDQYDRILPYI